MERASERFLIITHIMQRVVCVCVCAKDISSDVDMCLPPPYKLLCTLNPVGFVKGTLLKLFTASNSFPPSEMYF